MVEAGMADVEFKWNVHGMELGKVSNRPSRSHFGHCFISIVAVLPGMERTNTGRNELFMFIREFERVRGEGMRKIELGKRESAKGEEEWEMLRQWQEQVDEFIIDNWFAKMEYKYLIQDTSNEWLLNSRIEDLSLH